MDRELEHSLFAQKVAESKNDFVKKLDRQWLASVPDQYQGHSMKEVFGGTLQRGDKEVTFEEGWNGSLNESNVDKLRDYIDEPSKFLILRGDSGVGKSTLAATIGRKLIYSLSISALFVNSVSLLNEFSFRKEHDDPIDYFSSFGVLVIDDLGAVNESLTPHQQKSLWGLVESRWNKSGKYTIITTNMAIQNNEKGVGLSSWIGESGWDRISSDLVRVSMTGESLR